MTKLDNNTGIFGSTRDGLIVTIILIYSFFSHFYFFSSYFNRHLVFLLFIVVVLAIKFIHNIKSIRIEPMDFIGIVFIVYLFFNAAMSNYSKEAYEYFSFFAIMSFLLLYFKNTSNWASKFCSVTFYFAYFNVICIILQAIFPNLINSINKLLLTESDYFVMLQSFNNNYHIGITNQASVAGLISVILIALSFARILVFKKFELLYITSLLLAIVSLMLTQKRSFLVAALIALVVVLFIYNIGSFSQKFNRIVLTLSLILSFTILILALFPQTLKVFDRLFNDGDIFRSRREMYDTMFGWLESNKLFGEGLGAAQSIFGFGGHNIYIQMFAEIGFFGAILFYFYYFIFILKNIILTRQYMVDNKNDKKNHFMLLFALYMQMVFVIYGISGNPIYDYTIMILLVMILTLPRSIIKNKWMEKI